jgi:serine/threonine-protein kinase
VTTQTFGRYVIKEIVGRGGMSTVYLAHDPRFGRDVALKVMSTAFQNDPTFRGRFEREARTIATLEHPSIVPVYDFGEDEDQLYLVMRYMPGGSLAERIIEGPIAIDEALAIVKPIASALDHAHKHGIIHRDLKPGNILFDEYNNAFLSDFGIVKVAEATSSLTGSGVIGTPAYMSPEQVHGDQQLDGRSDIYTLGIILYEMLTTRKPFRADTPVKLMMAHVLTPAPSILDAKPDLPTGFDNIIQKTLSKKPEDRYANGREFTQALTLTITGSFKLPAIPPFESPTIATNSAAELGDLRTMTAAGLTVGEQNTVATEPPVLPESGGGRKRPWRWPWLLVGLIGLAALSFAIYYNLDPNQNITLTPETTPVVEVAFQTTPTGGVPTPTPSHTPSPTPSRTPTRTPTPTTTATPELPTPTPERRFIARSAGGADIEAIRYGDGANIIILVGGLHAGFAPASVELAQQMIDHFALNPEAIPDNATIYIVANANPDSPLNPGNLAGRFNANGVDLNRNWGCRWAQDATISGQTVIGSGGTAPFSEPEVEGLSEFILSQNPVAVIFWEARAAGGLVSPGSCQSEPIISTDLAQLYGTAAEYAIRDFEAITQQQVTGDGTNWLDDQEVPAIAVLLPDYNDADFEHNLAGVLAVLEAVAQE